MCQVPERAKYLVILVYLGFGIATIAVGISLFCMLHYPGTAAGVFDKLGALAKYEEDAITLREIARQQWKLHNVLIAAGTINLICGSLVIGPWIYLLYIFIKKEDDQVRSVKESGGNGGGQMESKKPSEMENP